MIIVFPEANSLILQELDSDTGGRFFQSFHELVATDLDALGMQYSTENVRGESWF